MKQREAERLLGGHATGTLTDEERRSLFAAALDHQELFDALMDEEALRELLADPAAKAQLLAALAPTALPKIVPFWRRTGVLGAAASLLVASLAGIAYLRSPGQAPPALRQEMERTPAAKVAEAPPAAQAAPPAARTPSPLEKAKEAPAPAQAAAPVVPPPPEPVPQRSVATAGGAPMAVAADASREKAAEFRRAEAQDNLAKKAEAPKSAAVVEVVASVAPAPAAKKSKADRSASGVAALSPGLVGGVVGGVAPAPAQRVEWKAAAEFKPSWSLEARPDGVTRITVKGPARASAVLLKRNAAGLEVLTPRVIDPGGEMATWSAEMRLAAGDVLDLYLLNAPATEPTRLPESGPVDGFRARIHPSSKKDSAP